MFRLLLVPLIPIFVLLVKSLIEDWNRERREKREASVAERPRAPRPKQKLYDHKWDDDNE